MSDRFNISMGIKKLDEKLQELYDLNNTLEEYERAVEGDSHLPVPRYYLVARGPTPGDKYQLRVGNVKALETLQDMRDGLQADYDTLLSEFHSMAAKLGSNEE